MSDIINTQLSGLNHAQRHLLTTQKPQTANEEPTARPAAAKQEEGLTEINSQWQRPMFDLNTNSGSPRLFGVEAAAASAEALRAQFAESGGGDAFMKAQIGVNDNSLRQLAALLLDD